MKFGIFHVAVCYVVSLMVERDPVLFAGEPGIDYDDRLSVFSHADESAHAGWKIHKHCSLFIHLRHLRRMMISCGMMQN